jgi:hypothetical protein
MENTKYVYIRSEPGLWTVGFYSPAGKWEPESDHTDREEAANRVILLNGEKEHGYDPRFMGLLGATKYLVARAKAQRSIPASLALAIKEAEQQIGVA